MIEEGQIREKLEESQRDSKSMIGRLQEIQQEIARLTQESAAIRARMISCEGRIVAYKIALGEQSE